jgi:hypothetical protein
MNMKMHLLISDFFGAKFHHSENKKEGYKSFFLKFKEKGTKSPYFKEKKVEFVRNKNKYYVIRK